MAVNPPRSCENSNIRRMWLTGGPKEKKKEDGKGIKGEPVSYTHLDVYKRQALYTT